MTARMVISVAVLGVLAVVAAAPGEKYTTKYDNVDVDNILKNDRLLLSYFNCVMGKGKCTPDGEELKSHIAEALETGCEKCSEKQKAGTEKVLRFMMKEKPDMYKEMETKYDNDGKYRKKYEKLAAEKGFTSV